VIEVKTFDTAHNVCHIPPIVSDVTIITMKIGYKVLINLKTRTFDISHYGSSSDFNGFKGGHICFEDENNKQHTVEWSTPIAYRHVLTNRLVEVEKDQVIIHYIDYSFLNCYFIEEKYECSAIKLKQTVDKLINPLT